MFYPEKGAIQIIQIIIIILIKGTILGPFCYTVFTNDMLSFVSDTIEIYNYADDNTVICSCYE